MVIEDAIIVTPQKPVIPIIAASDLIDVLSGLEQSESAGLSDVGRSSIATLNDLLFTAFSQPAPKNWAFPLDQVRDRAQYAINFSPYRAAYLTGGFDAGLHHDQLLQYMWRETHHRPIILGIESDSYIRAKGRDPILNQIQRISLWYHLAPSGTILFPIPEHERFAAVTEANAYYFGLAAFVGVARNPNVDFIFTEDAEKNGLLDALMDRAASPANICRIPTFGYPTPVHVSEYFS